MESTKRRRVETNSDYTYPAPTTSRTKAAAAAAAAAAASANRQPTSAGGAADASRYSTAGASSYASTSTALKDGGRVHQPILSLASLPPASLQRYLSRYGLLEPQGSLSYHHAVFPVPPLPAVLVAPLVGRNIPLHRATRSRALEWEKEERRETERMIHIAVCTDEQLEEEERAEREMEREREGKGRKRRRTSPWREPKTEEFRGLSAYDDTGVVTGRLAALAKSHWDKKDSIKEGETLTNFIFALRMRSQTLRATPPG